MVKRKRNITSEQPTKSPKQARTNGSSLYEAPANGSVQADSLTLQIVVGSYERALRGFTASIPVTVKQPPHEGEDEVQFADTFLFNAHASAIRCLAISPPSGSQNEKLVLATGSTDERINLYQLSTSPPLINSKVALPSLNTATVLENPKNRELGSLLHHSSSITALYFPSRSKLLSGSEDNTIAVSRTRDWTVLSTIKAPIPKPTGRPSGDTAALGEVPAGINDFAVHPSMKLMVSVGKGERCMRLWNLMTGKKAGVLNFDKDLLQRVGEGKHSSGEARKVEWDQEGEEYVVAFERGAVIYGLDSKPKAAIMQSPRAKIHQVRYLQGLDENILAISSEDGRILFYRTKPSLSNLNLSEDSKELSKALRIPECILLAQMGGSIAGISGRIKDFDIVSSNSSPEDLFFVAGSSDGAVRIWKVSTAEFKALAEETTPKTAQPAANGAANGSAVEKTTSISQIGHLLGTYETGHRITCLKSFVMTGKPQEKDGQNQNSSAHDSNSSDSPSESE